MGDGLGAPRLALLALLVGAGGFLAGRQWAAAPTYLGVSAPTLRTLAPCQPCVVAAAGRRACPVDFEQDVADAVALLDAVLAERDGHEPRPLGMARQMLAERAPRLLHGITHRLLQSCPLTGLRRARALVQERRRSGRKAGGAAADRLDKLANALGVADEGTVAASEKDSGRVVGELVQLLLPELGQDSILQEDRSEREEGEATSEVVSTEEGQLQVARPATTLTAPTPAGSHGCTLPAGETVQLVMISGDGAEGSMTAKETIPMLKSILQRNSCPVHVTIFTGGGSQEVLLDFFGRIQTPRHRLNYTLIELDLDFVASKIEALNLKYTHHSALWGFAKFFFPELLPARWYRHVLVIDTDYIFNDDICELWRWGRRHVFEAGMLHSSTVPRPGMGGAALCSCLSFFNLERMREMKWTTDLARQAFARYMPKKQGKIFVAGDQTMNVAIARFRRDLFVEAPRSWSLNLCQRMFGVRPWPSNRSTASLFFGAVHFNCPWHGKERQLFTPFFTAADLFRPEWLNGHRTLRNAFHNPWPPGPARGRARPRGAGVA